MTEFEWDKKLNIESCGHDYSLVDTHHHPYEPTPYSVLQRLAESGYLTAENVLIDYGCGKGRLGFFFCNEIGCKVIGVEHNDRLWRNAVDNIENFKAAVSPSFFCQKAEEFNCDAADCFYFFNPFTVEILRSVMQQIILSYYENPRKMRLFFYYPDPEYVSYLLTGDNTGILDALYFLDEIDCKDLFEGDNRREKILIFEINF